MHRGDVINLFRMGLGLTAVEFADLANININTLWQIQGGYRKGGPDLWKKFETNTGISIKDIDKFIARHKNRDPKEIMKRLIKS